MYEKDTFFFRLSQSEKRVGFETVPSLLYSAAEEGKKKKTSWPSTWLLLFSCVTATFAPSLEHIHLYLRTTCILRTAGYHILTQTTKRKKKKSCSHVVLPTSGTHEWSDKSSTVGSDTDVNCPTELLRAGACSIAP